MPLYDDATMKETRMDCAELAERIARVLHAEQKDKQGKPYIEHVRRVAEAVEGDFVRAVAWLHDSLEDVLTDPDGWRRLLAAGMPDDVVRYVEVLTRDRAESYEHYIERIAIGGGDVGITVKLADLRDNLRPGAESLRPRYLKAIERLEMAQKDRASV